MLQEASRNKWQKFLPALIGAVIVAGIVGFPSGRELLGRFVRSLRMQKVQAVNVNLSAFTDPNANPALHQMIAQMISDDVVVMIPAAELQEKCLASHVQSGSTGDGFGNHLQLRTERRARKGHPLWQVPVRGIRETSVGVKSAAFAGGKRFHEKI